VRLVSFRFATPVAAPAEFRAPSGASGFWLTATASDPFGASAPAQPALPIIVKNRPPTVLLAPGATAAAHRYDAAAATYLASAPLALFEDPDGDPLDAGGSTGDESCSAFSFAGGVLSVACARPFAVSAASYPTLSGFAGPHALVARASDGWAPVAVPVTLQVGNDVPSVESYTGAIEACTCQCPLWEPELPGVCGLEPTWVADPTHATFPLRPTDADGDPVNVTFTLAGGSPAGATVTPSARTGLPETSAATLSTPSFPVTVVVTANDGVSQAISSWTATRATCAKAGQLCTLPAGARRR